MEIFKYNEKPRRTNPLKTSYKLDSTTDKIRKLSDNVKKLENGRIFKKVKQKMEKDGIKFDSKKLPKSTMLPLGEFDKEGAGISDMVQRQLDTAHCGNIMNPDSYQEELSQSIYAIKKSNGTWQCIDGQHTITVLATFVNNGLMEHDGPWQTLEHPCLYVETDDVSFALRAFSLINGKGKKAISQYKTLENSVQIVRVCGNTTDADDVKNEKRVRIAQDNDCYAVEQNTSESEDNGAFTHISSFKGLSESVIKKTTAWHNEYYHFMPIDGALWFFMPDLINTYKNNNIKLTDEFLEELAGMVDNVFGDYQIYHSKMKSAYTKFTESKHGKALNWRDDCLAIGLVQLYKRLGGEADVPQVMLDEYNDFTNDGTIIDHLPESVTDRFDA